MPAPFIVGAAIGSIYSLSKVIKNKVKEDDCKTATDKIVYLTTTFPSDYVDENIKLAALGVKALKERLKNRKNNKKNPAIKINLKK